MLSRLVTFVRVLAVCVCLCLFVFQGVGYAEDSGTGAELKRKARLRDYAGGKDEQDLKLLTQLPSYTRKFVPQEDEKEAGGDAPADE